MSKINRQKLAKGTFLKSNKVNEFVNEVKDAVNNGNLDETNAQYFAPTRLVFNTRCLKADPGTDMHMWETGIGGITGDLGHWRTNTGGSAYSSEPGYDVNLWQHFLFHLPEPQENFDADGILDELSKNYSLSEVTIQADNLHNPASIYPTNVVPGYHSNSLSGADSMEIVVVIHRKTPSSKGDTFHWEEQMGSWTIPFAAFLDGSLSLNPYLFNNLNIKFAPDSIYLISIGFPAKNVEVDGSTTDFTNFIIMNNVQIGLKFLSDLRSNDLVSEDGAGVMTVQNAPIRQTEETSITTTDIVANEEITEATIQDNLEKLDEAAHRKLVGSYDDHGNFPNKPQIIGSSYGVQQVPLFNNNHMLWNWFWFQHGAGDSHVAVANPGFSTSALWYPYSGDPFPNIPNSLPPATPRIVNYVADRKFIPIHQPMTIHHILLTYWTGSPLFLTGKRCEDPNTKFEVAVILHTFGRGDTIARHQIAEAEFQPVTGDDTRTGDNLIVDQAYWLEQQNNESLIDSTKQTAGFTIQIPVNHGTTADKQGKGYVLTGPPLYVGQGEFGPTAGRASSRTGIYRRSQDDTIVNYTKGCEQAIEVIVRIKNEVIGIAEDIYVEDDPITFDGSVKVQQPGMMMYLIGKTPLQNPRW
jgi:hypothetical protein